MALASDGGPRFSDATMVAAARMYYLEHATQGAVAERLGVSRPTVSRLLTEARRRGIVRIDVLEPPGADLEALGARVAEALGLVRVALAAVATEPSSAAALAPAVGTLLRSAGLGRGDGLLISSGRTLHEVAAGPLPSLPGVRLAPTLGGQDEAEPWYATNDITRQIAAKVGGTPVFLYAPAMPAAGAHRLLREDPSIRRVLDLWRTATCALIGVGAAPLSRTSIPAFVPLDAPSLRSAVGDVTSRFYDAEGAPVPFPGDDRLFAVELETLRGLPASIAVAAGPEKVAAIIAGARGGYFDRLATDAATGAAILAALD